MIKRSQPSLADGMHSGAGLVPLAAGRSVLVAVIDSGWKHDYRDSRVLPGVGLVGAEDELELEFSADYYDRHGHGTACTEIILGIAPRVHILPIRVFGHRLEASVSQLVAALRFAAERHVDVVNLSLATVRDDAIPELYTACDAATRAGAILVASSQRGDRCSYPAVFDNTIGVEGSEDLEHLQVRYREHDAVEFTACGRPADWRSAPGRISNSFAAARISGLTALFREEQPDGTVVGGRDWLAARAVTA